MMTTVPDLRPRICGKVALITSSVPNRLVIIWRLYISDLKQKRGELEWRKQKLNICAFFSLTLSLPPAH
jgi:hypothetical protein